jgi:hypothetical protein
VLQHALPRYAAGGQTWHAVTHWQDASNSAVRHCYSYNKLFTCSHCQGCGDIAPSGRRGVVLLPQRLRASFAEMRDMARPYQLNFKTSMTIPLCTYPARSACGAVHLQHRWASSKGQSRTCVQQVRCSRHR